MQHRVYISLFWSTIPKAKLNEEKKPLLLGFPGGNVINNNGFIKKELLKGIHIIARLFNRFNRHIIGDFIYEDSIYSITPFS